MTFLARTVHPMVCLSAHETPLILLHCDVLLQKAKTECAVQLFWPDEDAGTPEDARESWYDIVPTDSVDFSQHADL